MKLREMILLLRDVEAVVGPDADVRIADASDDRTTLAAQLTLSGDAVVLSPIPSTAPAAVSR